MEAKSEAKSSEYPRDQPKLLMAESRTCYLLLGVDLKDNRIDSLVLQPFELPPIPSYTWVPLHQITDKDYLQAQEEMVKWLATQKQFEMLVKYCDAAIKERLDAVPQCVHDLKKKV